MNPTGIGKPNNIEPLENIFTYIDNKTDEEVYNLLRYHITEFLDYKQTNEDGSPNFGMYKSLLYSSKFVHALIHAIAVRGITMEEQFCLNYKLFHIMMNSSKPCSPYMMTLYYLLIRTYDDRVEQVIKSSNLPQVNAAILVISRARSINLWQNNLYFITSMSTICLGLPVQKITDILCIMLYSKSDIKELFIFTEMSDVFKNYKNYKTSKDEQEKVKDNIVTALLSIIESLEPSDIIDILKSLYDRIDKDRLFNKEDVNVRISDVSPSIYPKIKQAYDFVVQSIYHLPF